MTDPGTGTTTREEPIIAAVLETTLPRVHAPRVVRPLRILSAATPSVGVRFGVLGALAWLFVGPRIELVAGLRVEDLVFLLLGAVCLLHVKALGRPMPPTVAIAAVVATGLASAVLWSVLGTVGPVTSVLFAVRPLEYWILFPAVLLIIKDDTRTWQRRLRLLLAGVTMLQSGFAALQYFFELDVGFSHASYARAAGLTVGPYELGAVSAMLLIFWLSRRELVLAGVAAVGLVTSISRISIIGALVAVLLLAVWTAAPRLVRRSGGLRLIDRVLPRDASRGRLIRTGVIAAAVALVIGVGAGLLSSPAGRAATGPVVGPITSRFASTSVLGSWDAADGLAAAVPPVRTSTEYSVVAYSNMGSYVQAGEAGQSGAEPSNLVRFYRWHLILDTMNNPLKWLFGLGPSFVGPSVDGTYLRFLADAGLLGAAAWFGLIGTWLRRAPVWMVCVTVTMLVGAVFIDILFAQRPMALFWTMLAMSWRGWGDAPPVPRHRRPLPNLRPRLRLRPGRRRAALPGA